MPEQDLGLEVLLAVGGEEVVQIESERPRVGGAVGAKTQMGGDEIQEEVELGALLLA